MSADTLAPPKTSVPQPDRPRRRKSTARREAVIVNTLLILGVVVMIAPFYWQVAASLKPAHELASAHQTWYPHALTLQNYRDLGKLLDLPQEYKNSIIVAGVVTVSNLLFCSMLGYALAKLRFPGRGVVFGLVLGTLMVPGTVLVIPLYVLAHQLGLVNTLLGVALPTLVTPFGVFLMRQFFLQVPDSLLEAARIDGSGEWRTFFRICLPLVGPGLATLGILTFLSSWNNFLWPQIVLNDQSKYTIPVAVATFANDPNQAQGSNGVLMAGSVAVVIPVVLVFIALQRYFTRGVAMSGIKG
ncbi:carbohydrate ABC transporter permease [Streptomyces mirabilis]|uniref:carbohydrate ABC transporter permease n=1 Tax=Streptomyces mirabilis TaxID=68239 RepID=UPI0036868EC8